MLSSIRKSKKAVEINIAIRRAFVMLRELTTGYAEIKKQKRPDTPRNPVGYVIPKK